MKNNETMYDPAERVKQWWKRYGNLATILLIVVLALIAGSQFFHRQTAQKDANASVLYDNLLAVYANKHSDEVSATAQQLIQTYPNTPYATFAAFIAAKAAIENGQVSAAVTPLQWAVSHASSNTLASMARIRLARVYIETGAPQQAIDTLTDIKSEFRAEADFFKGQAYAALQNTPEAVKAYQQALSEAEPGSPLAHLIAMALYRYPSA
jgi:predicted negative regulator of RcsB-dependent stress response